MTSVKYLRSIKMKYANVDCIYMGVTMCGTIASKFQH